MPRVWPLDSHVLNCSFRMVVFCSYLREGLRGAESGLGWASVYPRVS